VVDITEGFDGKSFKVFGKAGFPATVLSHSAASNSFFGSSQFIPHARMVETGEKKHSENPIQIFNCGDKLFAPSARPSAQLKINCPSKNIKQGRNLQERKAPNA